MKNYQLSKARQCKLSILISICMILFSVKSINVIHEKKNILIKQNGSYVFQVNLEKENADLIPSYLDIQYDIFNYNGTSCNYFDFFYYVSQADIDCYNYAIGNQQYLFPCPFLSNNYAIIRTNKVSGLNQMQRLQINKIQNLNYTFIVDNTKFPFPSGAFPYTDININLKTSVSIEVSSLYEELALRLIAINATVLSIFLFIIVVLIWKQRRIKKQMEGEKKTTIQMNLSPNGEEKKNKLGEESDSDQQQNYAEFLGKTISPSLLDNKERSVLVEYG